MIHEMSSYPLSKAHQKTARFITMEDYTESSFTDSTTSLTNPS